MLFFLDGDDQFLPPHLTACWRAMREGKFDYVKSGVRLADPVHADWRGPIEHTLVINLAVRRSCHDAVGGFPDYHLYRREGDCMEREADVFVTGEDQAYNRLLAGLFRGGKVAAETVQYVRRPGNAYDRQYEKFRRPRGTHPETHGQDEEYRLGLAEVIVQKRLAELRKAVPGAGSAAAWSALTAAQTRCNRASGDVRRRRAGRGWRPNRGTPSCGGRWGRRCTARGVMRRPWTPSRRRCGCGRRTPTPTPGRRRPWRRWAAATRPRSASAGRCSCGPTTARRRPGWACCWPRRRGWTRP